MIFENNEELKIITGKKLIGRLREIATDIGMGLEDLINFYLVSIVRAHDEAELNKASSKH